MTNLTAYSAEGDKLFIRHCDNKEMAKKAIVNNPWLFRTAWILFKNKKYFIKEIYKW